MKQHRRRLAELVVEYRETPTASAPTRRGLGRKIAMEASAHGCLCAPLEGAEALTRWQDLAGAAALAWRMAAPLPESLLGAIEEALREEARVAPGVVLTEEPVLAAAG